MKTPRVLLSLVLLLALTPALMAQEHIALDQDTSNRLGLVFMRLSAADSASGTRFPATVIASPHTASQVFALYEGVLQHWSVSPGTEVRAGDELAVLRSPAVLALQQEWVTATSVAEQAEVARERDQRLFAAGVIAEQRLRDSERRADAATFQRDSLASALAQAGYTGNALQALVRDRGSLGLYRVRAPQTGTVGSLGHRSGELIAASEPLLSLSDDERWLSAEVPAWVAARLVVGQPLGLVATAAELELRQWEQALDTRTQTVELLAAFTAPTDLLPGQVVTLLLPPREVGVLVPAEAVVHNGDETVLYVRVADGVEARTLELLPAGGDYLATAGLAPGDEVVVRGAALLKGMTLGLGGE